MHLINTLEVNWSLMLNIREHVRIVSLSVRLLERILALAGCGGGKWKDSQKEVMYASVRFAMPFVALVLGGGGVPVTGARRDANEMLVVTLLILSAIRK